MHLRAKSALRGDGERASERAKGQSNLARTREGTKGEAQFAPQPAAAATRLCRCRRSSRRPRDLGDGGSIFSSSSNGDQQLHYAPCPLPIHGWDAFVVDDASVPVFPRIANLFKRPALIRIQEAKREEEGRKEGGIHPRPGLASFVCLGAASAGSREF